MAYGEYSGPCIGRLMAFLYKYTFLSDHWQFGNGNIISGGRRIGTFGWKGITDIPEFNFIDPDYAWLNAEHESKWLEIAKWTLRFQNPKKPYFRNSFREPDVEYTTRDSIAMVMGTAFTEAFFKVYAGDPEKVLESEYDAIAYPMLEKAYRDLGVIDYTTINVKEVIPVKGRGDIRIVTPEDNRGINLKELAGSKVKVDDKIYTVTAVECSDAHNTVGLSLRD